MKEILFVGSKELSNNTQQIFNELCNSIKLECKYSIINNIDLDKYSIIVCFGNETIKKVFRKYNIKINNLDELHGKLFKIKTLFGEKDIVPLYSLHTANYASVLKWELINDFKLIKKLIE